MGNEYPFAVPTHYDCTEEGFRKCYDENTPYTKDGILFHHKEADYIAGPNPYIMLWKDKWTSEYVIESSNEGKE